MMSAPSPDSGRPPRASHATPKVSWPAMLAVALAIGHFVWLATHHAAAIMSPDANGYVVQGRLIATEGRTWFAAESPAQFTGMHWLETKPGVFHSRYPAGLPLLFAAAWQIGGLDAALWINPVLASLTLLLVFLLARRMTGEWYALLAAAVIASVPVFNQHALDADAHIAAAFLLVAGVAALLRFAETRQPLVGALAGLLLGALPTVRYPEALAGVTIGAWLIWQIRPWWRAWPAVAGALVPVGALCAHNAAAYGAFWKTGYALTGEQTGFGLNYFVAHAIPYLQALGGQGLGLMFAFGAAGLGALLVEARRRAAGVLFAGITVPLVLLYMAYYFGGGPGGPGGGVVAVGGNLRFLIPVLPFFAIAAVWLLERTAAGLGRAGLVAVGVAAGLQILIGVASSVPAVTQASTAIRAAARARQVAEKEIPPASVVILERTLAESLDAVGRWKLVEESIVGGMGGMGEFGPGRAGVEGGGRGFRPGGFGGARGGAAANGGPSPQQPGKNRNQLERYRGVSSTERQARLWSDLQTWAAGRPIFWLTRSLDAVEIALPRGADYHSIAEVDAPMMGGPGMAMPGAARGGRGAFGPPGMRGGGFGPPDGPGAMNAAVGAPSKLRLVRIAFAKE